MGEEATVVVGNALPPHIAILPSPRMGHLIPLAELAKCLIHQHHFTVTFLTADDSSKAQKSFLDSLPAGVSSLALPTPDLSDLHSNTKIETRISVTVARSLPNLLIVLRRLKEMTNLVTFIVDPAGKSSAV